VVQAGRQEQAATPPRRRSGHGRVGIDLVKAEAHLFCGRLSQGEPPSWHFFEKAELNVAKTIRESRNLS
jgi:hypothetical protein